MAVFQGSPRVARQSVSDQARQVGPGAGAAKVSTRAFPAETGKFSPPYRWQASRQRALAGLQARLAVRDRALTVSLGPKSLLSLTEGCF